MASTHLAPSESRANSPAMPPPAAPSKEESKPTPEPVKNADNQIKPGQPWIWGFTMNEIALIILQIVATVIAAIFGAWAVRSYDSAKIANELSKNSLSKSQAANMLSEAALDQTSMANQLAILALCQTDPLNSSPACSAVRSAIQLPSLMSAVIPSLTIASNPITGDNTTPTITVTTNATPQPSASEEPTAVIISLGGIIGIIVGIVVFITIIGLLIVGRRRARMRSREPLAHTEL